ncbi:MAG: Ppx/GppA family phosphatase [Deltaproteobacteria bacterium]|nr:Ppx/GppA family phosphatase [Deltaproteobacteria bacterium]
MDRTSEKARVLGAIDVGTNAVRLEIVRAHPDGVLETLHYERAAVRPGDGVFESGIMQDVVADRLVGTLQRFASRCERHDAEVRAVATSALRNARNADAVLHRVRTQAGIALEVISGREEARLICLGVCQGRPADERALVLDIGGGSTEVALAKGGQPTQLWSVQLGAVQLTEMFGAAEGVGKKKVALMRAHAKQVINEGIGEAIEEAPDVVFGSSGTIRAVTEFACAGETAQVDAKDLAAAVRKLIAMNAAERLERFTERRADIIVAGGVILESLLVALGLSSVVAVNRGLRNGILIDLQDRERIQPRERLLADEALHIGRRFDFEEAHGREVARFALQLFDELGPVHGLPMEARSLLEIAAWLHDVGKAVGFQRHHRHGQYLIQNTEILGLVDRERRLAACVARFHRRSPPDECHPAMSELSRAEVRVVRRLATLLRLADAFDRSHQQRVVEIRTLTTDDRVEIELCSSQDLDLELWDGMREAPLFETVFGRALVLRASPTA